VLPQGAAVDYLPVPQDWSQSGNLNESHALPERLDVRIRQRDRAVSPVFMHITVPALRIDDHETDDPSVTQGGSTSGAFPSGAGKHRATSGAAR
jgi:hypothetical protein